MNSPRAKKSLGQHFLHDENISQKIVESLIEKLTTENVVEVGPGPCAYQVLTERKINLKLVELDQRMIEHLHSEFPETKNKIINKDFLAVRSEEIFENDFSVIGNFPYNISSQILFKVLENRDKIPLMVGMFQKEVADRITSIHGNKVFGILSVLVQAFYDAENLFTVHESSFTPPPKVKSGVIRLSKKREPLALVNEKFFFAFVKQAFNQRRKTLRNSLSSLIPKEKLQHEIFGKRAEQLSVQQFIELANQFVAFS